MEEEPKVCQNCKREIPAENFLTHQVHCSRNIRLCPVCKEPVPQNELDDHHEKLHKLLPCKQCGESVCGTDLEDHIRDSCALTVRSCRFCELELPRRDLPPHEGYCGVRTEQCAECREWVMIKYRQLHLDSNHGFLRLDDDPAPPNPNTRLPLTSNGESSLLPKRNNPTPKNINLLQNTPKPALRYFNDTSSSSGPSNSGSQSQSSASDVVANVSRPQGVTNGAVSKAPLKRTNDQPQINTAVAATNKVDKDLPVSRGAVKKRPAPKPPVKESPPADPKRDLPYYGALHRSQQEEKRRREQSAYNASIGLPPILSPAAKLEKLRKMDALQNREVQDKDYKDKLQGRVWQRPDAMPSGQRLGNSSKSTECSEPSRENFKNLKPMSPEQFMDRFRELQLMAGGSGEEKRPEKNEEAVGGDRFGEIKTNLSQLRRGLNQIIYSYDNNSNIQAAEVNEDISDSSPPLASPSEAEVSLPCEFCGAPLPLQDLVLHQTGCRPDLVQYRPHEASPRDPSPPPLAASRVRSPSPRVISPVPMARTPAFPNDIPVIPCEFCAESLPIYLITEHQERCGRENNLLYPD